MAKCGFTPNERKNQLSGMGGGALCFVMISSPANERKVFLHVGDEMYETPLVPNDEDTCYLFNALWYEKVKHALEKFPVVFAKSGVGESGNVGEFDVDINGPSIHNTHIELGSVAEMSVVVRNQ